MAGSEEAGRLNDGADEIESTLSVNSPDRGPKAKVLIGGDELIYLNLDQDVAYRNFCANASNSGTSRIESSRGSMFRKTIQAE